MSTLWNSIKKFQISPNITIEVVDEILKKKAIYAWIIFAKFPETGKNCTKVIKTSANFKFEIHNLLRLNID